MTFHTKNLLDRFFERNLFERIIFYIFISEVVTKIIFELALGQWGFTQSQNKQWFFYGFLALDYLISARKVINIRVTFNPMSALAIVFLIMVVHGLFIGLVNGNSLFVIFNDTVPPLMIALNVLRMQSSAENDNPIDFRFLFTACTALALAACLTGFLAVKLGQPSQTSVGSSALYYPMLMAALFTLRPFPKWAGVAALIMIVLVLGDINRTTMLFLAIVVSGYALIKTVRDPAKGLLAFLVIPVIAAMFFAFVPEDSKTYNRVIGLTNVDLSARTGSIGERAAEWDAIQAMLESKGKTVQWLGPGFGGVYNVHFTHHYLTDYGHAHYIWAWFNLRFGRSGYIYMALFLAALVYNAGAGLRARDETGVFVSFLCLLGLIYCMTHVNSVFLLSGIHFLHRRREV